MPSLCGLLQKFVSQTQLLIYCTVRLGRIRTSTTTRGLENLKLSAPKLTPGSRTKVVQIHFNGGVLRKNSFINQLNTADLSIPIWDDVVFANAHKLNNFSFDGCRSTSELQNNLWESMTEITIWLAYVALKGHKPDAKCRKGQTTAAIVKTWLVWKCPHVYITPALSADINVIKYSP